MYPELQKSWKKIVFFYFGNVTVSLKKTCIAYAEVNPTFLTSDLDSFLKNAFPLRCEPEQNQNAEKSDSEYFDSSSTGIWYVFLLTNFSRPANFWGSQGQQLQLEPPSISILCDKR